MFLKPRSMRSCVSQIDVIVFKMRVRVALILSVETVEIFEKINTGYL